MPSIPKIIITFAAGHKTTSNYMNPILKRSALVIAAIIVIDQVVKIWVKTHMFLGESSYINWDFGIRQAQLLFTENPGMAFGWALPGNGGKIALSIFRILAIAGMIYYILWAVKNRKPHKGFITCMSMILAGAIGNMIDCMFYGMVFSQSGYSANSVAEFMPAMGGYAPFLQGKVVDMLYFPIIDAYWPDWMPFVGGNHFTFFSPIFNIADSAVTVGVALILIFQKRYFPKTEEELEEEKAAAEKAEIVEK